MIHQIVSLKAVGTSTFILARHTEGSTYYLLPTKSGWVQLLYFVNY